MANLIKSIQPIKYSTTLRANPQKPEEAKKAYANLQLSGTVNLSQLAEHIREHGSPYGRDVVIGVLTAVVDCTKEYLLQGFKVDLGDLGQFEPGIRSDGAESKEDFSANNIKEVVVNYTLGGIFTDLREKATFEKVATRRAQAATLAAENAGHTTSDWTPEEEEGEGD